MSVDYYAVLGVSSTASFEEIRRAYRKCAFVAHPDHGGSQGQMLALNEAWEVLRHAESRAAYDARRRVTTRRAWEGGTKTAAPRGTARGPVKKKGPKPPSFAQMAGTFLGSAFRAITGTGASRASRAARVRIVLCQRCGQKLRVKPKPDAAKIICPKCRHAQSAR